MDRFVFTDLDDTLFTTKHKLTNPTQECVPATLGKANSFRSYSSPTQLEILNILRSIGTLIPITGRNHASYRRILHRLPRQAILDFGGIILDSSGTPDQDWKQKVERSAKASDDLLDSTLELWAQINQRQKLNLSIKIVEDFGLPLYVVAKHPEGNIERLDCLEEANCLDEGLLNLHRNGNNFTAIPKYFSKKTAMEFFVQKYCNSNDRLMIGVGDSISDCGFMSLCDFCITPSDSQLWQSFAKIE